MISSYKKVFISPTKKQHILIQKFFILLLVNGYLLTSFSQEHNYILGANFSFGYKKNESYLAGNTNLTISSNNNTSFLFGSFISKRFMIGGGANFNSSKFLSDDGTNVFEENAAGVSIFPDVRYYIPLKKMSLFLENKIYFGYSERSSQIDRAIRTFDNGVQLKFGLGFFIKKLYLEASLNTITFNKIKTITPIDDNSERINDQTTFDMLKDFTNINLGIYYHFGKSKYHSIEK